MTEYIIIKTIHSIQPLVVDNTFFNRIFGVKNANLREVSEI